MSVIRSADRRLSEASSDAYYMAKAFELARRGRYTCQPNPQVGCLIVKQGQVIGQGYHAKAGEAHAEINALESVAGDVRGATWYVTLEPCSHQGRTGPCTQAVLKAAPARVVVASPDPNPLVAGQGLEALTKAGIELQVGVGAAQNNVINRAYMQRMDSNKPFVRLKVAMSLDGKTAMSGGQSKWITAASSRQDVHALRLEACAVLTGIDTVLADDPQMTARLDCAQRQPTRIVLDSQSRMPANAKILSGDGRALVYQAKPDTKLSADNVEVVKAATNEAGRVDLHELLADLAQRNINHLLVEAGATLSGQFIEQGLVDELIVYIAPDVMGHEARSAFFIPGISELSQRFAYAIKDSRMVGRDIKLMLER